MSVASSRKHGIQQGQLQRSGFRVWVTWGLTWFGLGIPMVTFLFVVIYAM
jgi:hypothetical protein